MDILRLIWESTSTTFEGAWGLAALGAFALLFTGLTLRARMVRPFAVRPMVAAERLRVSLGRAMETGEEVHVALGIGGLGDRSTADTLAGLSLVSHLARRGALGEVPVRVRVAEPTALVGALAALQYGALGAGYPEAFEPTQAEWVAPSPLAYAAGVAAGLQQERPVINAMIGSFGPEVALPGEEGVWRGLAQVGGTSNPAALPLLAASVEAPLVGEEIYALGAALGRADHTGSLAAQDVCRVVLAVGIVLAAILGLCGL